MNGTYYAGTHPELMVLISAFEIFLSDLLLDKAEKIKNQENKMTVFVVAEHDSSSLKCATMHTVTAASELVLLGSPEVHLLVAGQQAVDAAIAATKVSGVGKVIYAEGENLARGMIDNIAAQVLAVAHHSSHILLPATAWGERIATRIGTMLDVAPVRDVIGIRSLDTFERRDAASNLIVTGRNRDAVKVLTVLTDGFDAAGQGGTATIEGVKPIADSHAGPFRRGYPAKGAQPELLAA